MKVDWASLEGKVESSNVGGGIEDIGIEVTIF